LGADDPQHKKNQGLQSTKPTQLMGWAGSFYYLANMELCNELVDFFKWENRKSFQ